jgi:hypothetical protein
MASNCQCIPLSPGLSTSSSLSRPSSSASVMPGRTFSLPAACSSCEWPWAMHVWAQCISDKTFAAWFEV